MTWCGSRGVVGKPSSALVGLVSSERASKCNDSPAFARCSTSSRSSSWQVSKLAPQQQETSCSARSICRGLASNTSPAFALWSVLGLVAGAENAYGSSRQISVNGGCRRGQHQRRPRAADDDFDVGDDVEFDMDGQGLDDDEDEDIRDYETEYESPTGYRPVQGDTDTFINTEGEEQETVVGWKINEDEFHKFKLLTCDFFIRRVPDPDGDVYDFREMYVTPTDTDIYSIPKVVGEMPKKPVRCHWSTLEYIYTTEPPVDQPRSPLCKTEMEVMKIFLIKHLKDRRTNHKDFILDFEEVYVIDCKSKSFSRVDVKVEVPGGRNRDRSQEVLIVRDDGTSFRIIPEEDMSTPDEIVLQAHWDSTKEAMDRYLRGFRDYEISNWF